MEAAHHAVSLADLPVELLNVIIDMMAPDHCKYKCTTCDNPHTKTTDQDFEFLQCLAALCKTSRGLNAACTPILRRHARRRLTRSALSEAASFGRTKELILANKAVEDINDPRMLLLHCACVFGREKTVRYLLSTGKMDVNATDEYGFSPLLYAAKSHSIPTAKALLDNGAVNVGFGKDTLAIELVLGTTKLLEKYTVVPSEKSLQVSCRLHPDPPLMELCNKLQRYMAAEVWCGRIVDDALRMARFVAKQPLEIDVPQRLLNTLIFAAKANAYDVAETVLQNTTCRDGRVLDSSLLRATIQQTHDDRLVAILLDHDGDNDKLLYGALYESVRSGRLHMVDLLLEREAKVNGAGTPSLLIEGVECKDLRVLELLLEHGADARCHGNDALLLAESGERWDAACLLIDYGAVPRARPYRNGGTILHFAAKGCKVATFKTLMDLVVSRGHIDVNHPDDQKKTALHYAAHGFESTNVKTLLQYGADFNTADIYGNTALAIATRRRRYVAVETLLEQPGINFEYVDMFGRTVFSDAHENSNRKTFAVLREYASTHDITWPEKHKSIIDSEERYSHFGKTMCDVCFRCMLDVGGQGWSFSSHADARHVCSECYKLPLSPIHDKADWVRYP